MEPLYCALSGDEIVWALRHAGFRTTSLDATSAALERARARVVVPRGRLLDGQELRAILRAAGVSYLEVLDLLDGARAIAI